MKQDQQPRFSIRKLTIGAVSVMFGLVMLGANNQVHAATTDEGSQTQANTEDSQTQAKTDESTTDSEKILDTKPAKKSVTLRVASQAPSSDNTTVTSQAATKSIPPQAGEDYTAQSKAESPALLFPSDKKQDNSKPTFVDKNGVVTNIEFNAKNKEGQITTIGLNDDTKDSKLIYNTSTASDANFKITITNPTDKTQDITGFGDYAYQFPAWDGTNANIVVDASRTKTDAAGNIVFDGNYSEQRLSLTNFGMAAAVGSSGYSKSAADAAKDPSKIAGFTVVGKLQAGKSATIVVPFTVKDVNRNYPVTTSSPIGIFYKTGFNIADTAFETNLSDQVGKDYFLVDMTGVNANTRELHSVPQSVIDALVKDNKYPTYEDGDASVNNFSFNYYKPGKDDFLTKEAQVNLNGAMKRLDSTLRSFGYKLLNFGSATDVQNGYFYRSEYKFYDAQGKPIQLGTGNISSLFLPVERVIYQKADAPTLLEAQGPDDNDQTYIQTVKNMFTDDASVDTSQIDIHKAGVYPVKVSKDNTSRVFNVVVFNTVTPHAYKSSDANHVDLMPDSIINDDSKNLLKDNGYTVSWVKAPSYDAATNEVPVEIVITDADGRTFNVKDHISVLQKITVNFKDGDQTVAIFPLYSYANNSNTFGDQVSWADSSAKAKWNDTLNNLKEKYVIDSDSVKNALNTVFESQKDDQTVDVKLLTDTTESKIYTRTIEYVGTDKNDSTKNIPVNGAPDGKSRYVQTVTFTRHIIKDGDKVVKTTDWTSDQPAFADVVSKAPKDLGYDLVDKATVAGMSVDSKSDETDLGTIIVTYSMKKTATGDPTTQPSKPILPIDHEATSYTRTIRYVDENNKLLQDPVVQVVTQTRPFVVDKNGNKHYGSWSDNKYEAVKNPVVDGYFTNEKDVDAENAVKDETITIHYTKKQSQTDDPTTNTKPALEQRSKTYTRTINYVDENGAALQTPFKQEVTITKWVSVDPETKKETDVTNWTKADFEAVKNPVIDGYFTNEKDVSAENATKDETITIHYTKKQSQTDDPIIQPDNPVYPLPQPEPQPQPDVPNDNGDNNNSDNNDVPAPHGEDQPTNPNTDNTSNDEETVKPHASETPAISEKVVATNDVNNGKTNFAHSSAQNTTKKHDDTVRPLPQTGAKQNSASIMGLVVASIAGLFGIAADRKKKN